MSAAPDVPGFIAAQERLIDLMGTDVTFHVRTPKVYDDAVQLDPQTREPYDPTQVHTSGGDEVDTQLRVGTVRRLLDAGADDDVSESAGGVMRADRAALAVKVGDFPAVETATEVTIAGERYRITDMAAEQINSTIFRHVVYLETAS